MRRRMTAWEAGGDWTTQNTRGMICLLEREGGVCFWRHENVMANLGYTEGFCFVADAFSFVHGCFFFPSIVLHWRAYTAQKLRYHRQQHQ